MVVVLGHSTFKYLRNNISPSILLGCDKYCIRGNGIITWPSHEMLTICYQGGHSPRHLMCREWKLGTRMYMLALCEQRNVQNALLCIEMFWRESRLKRSCHMKKMTTVFGTGWSTNSSGCKLGE